jgi:hypothetical protein
VLVALLVSVPHTFMVVVASALFFGIDAITLEVVIFGMTVLMVVLVLTAINSLAATSPPMPPPSGPSFQPDAAPFMCVADAKPETSDQSGLPLLPALIAEKLPSRLRSARLIASEAEDRYLCIHTDAGSDLVLIRMTDACALLPETASARVHRSWWASRGAA